MVRKAPFNRRCGYSVTADSSSRTMTTVSFGPFNSPFALSKTSIASRAMLLMYHNTCDKRRVRRSIVSRKV